VTTGGPADHEYAVVIPTLGRPTLAAAVLSTIAQHPRPREIVVVVDGTDPGVVPDYLMEFHRVVSPPSCKRRLSP